MNEQKKVVVFVAHPDDETACGGTLAKLSENNYEIVQIIATNGDKGTHDKKVLPKQLSEIRKKEMDNAAQILGLKKVEWFDFPDGSLEKNVEDLKEKCFRVIRKEKPDIVISFDPWKKWDVHSDHRTIGFVASEAAYLANSIWYYPEHYTEGLKPHEVKETYLFHTDEPNHIVDITETFETKKRAADAHESQSLEFASFGDKYLSGLKKRIKNKEDIYKEYFRKLNDSNLYI